MSLNISNYFFETHDYNQYDFPHDFKNTQSKYQKLSYNCKKEFEKNMWNEDTKTIIDYNEYTIHIFTVAGHHMGERKWYYVRYKYDLFYDKGKICAEFVNK